MGQLERRACCPRYNMPTVTVISGLIYVSLACVPSAIVLSSQGSGGEGEAVLLYSGKEKPQAGRHFPKITCRWTECDGPEGGIMKEA